MCRQDRGLREHRAPPLGHGVGAAQRLQRLVLDPGDEVNVLLADSADDGTAFFYVSHNSFYGLRTGFIKSK